MNIHHYLLRIGMWLTLVAIMGLNFGETVKAQEISSTCRGVDLIILVDQSITMLENDPEQLRSDAIRLFVDSLGNDILYECQGFTHRLAVIGFAGQRSANMLVDPIAISPSLPGGGLELWKNRRSELRSLVPDDIESIGGGTDYLSGFELAKAILDEWRATPLDQNSRLQGIILVADGGPCLNIVDGVCFRGGGSQNAYMASLEAYLDPSGTNFPWRGLGNSDTVSIWFIAMNITNQGSPYNFLGNDTNLRESWSRIVENHGGSLISLDSGRSVKDLNRDLIREIAKIADELTGSGPKPVVCEEPFYIEPYIERAMIRILKIGSDPSVDIDDVEVAIVYEGPKETAKLVGGKTQSSAITIEDYVSDGPIEYYVVGAPLPGVYRIEVAGADECRDLDVRYEEFPLRGEIVEPDSATVVPQFDETPYFDQAEIYNLVFSIVGGGKDRDTAVKIVSDPDFPLTLTASITNPEGIVQNMAFVEQDGLWTSIDPIEVPVAGTYQWSLIGTALGAESQESDERFSDLGAFVVRPVRRFKIEILEPSDGESIALNRFELGQLEYETFEVVAQLQDAVDGTPLTQSEIALSRIFPPLSVSVVSNGQESEPIPMAYDSTREAWVAVVTPGQLGVPTSVGSQQLRIILDETRYNKNDFRPDAVAGTDAIRSVLRALVLEKGTAVVSDNNAPIPQYDIDPYYDPNDPSFFSYELNGYADQASPSLLNTFPPDRFDVMLNVSLNGQEVQSETLVYENAGMWRSENPLLVRDDGTYTWAVTVQPRNQEDLTIVNTLTDQGQFLVSRVGRYRVELLQPISGGEYALNEIVGQRSVDVPLSVEVSLIDEETDAPLSLQDLRKDADPSSIISVTVQGLTESTGPFALSYDKTSLSWRAILETTQGQTPDEDGDQTLRVSFAAEMVDSERYRPSLEQNDLVARFERIVVQPIMLVPSLTNITSQIYRGSTGCFNSELIPLSVQVHVAEAGGSGSKLDIGQVAVGSLESLVSAQLIDPKTQEILETGRIELSEFGGTQNLTVVVGLDHVKPGQYQIRIVPNQKVVRTGYQFLTGSDPISVDVERSVGFWYRPSTCRGIQIGGVVILVAILFYMLYCWLNRPRGIIEFVDNSGMQMQQTRLGRSLSNLYRTSQVIKVPSTWGISRVVVYRASSEESAGMASPYGEIDDIGDGGGKTASGRVVKIIVFDEKGAEMGAHTLVSSPDPLPIIDNIQVKYT